MAAMQFSCPHCSGLFQVDSSLGGQQVSCPHCGGLVAVPAMAGYSAPGAVPVPYPGGGAPSYSQELPVRAAAPIPGIGSGGPGQSYPVPGQERPVAPAAGFPTRAQTPSGPERPLGGPQPQRPLRPLPAGTQAASQPASPELPGRGPGLAQAPQVPNSQRPTMPQRPVPLPQPATSGGTRVPMTGPQPGLGALGTVDALLPPGTAAGSAAMPGMGRGPQAPVTPATAPALVPQPVGGPARPLVVPTPDGSYVHLREPTKIVGSGDDALELRSRSGVDKEKWRFKKNLVIWAFGLLLLGITIFILMTLGPLRP